MSKEPYKYDPPDYDLKEAERKGYLAGLDAAAKVARDTVCDVHLPTGVRIYGNKAADAILALKERHTGGDGPADKER